MIYWQSSNIVPEHVAFKWNCFYFKTRKTINDIVLEISKFILIKNNFFFDISGVLVLIMLKIVHFSFLTANIICNHNKLLVPWEEIGHNQKLLIRSIWYVKIYLQIHHRVYNIVIWIALHFGFLYYHLFCALTRFLHLKWAMNV